MSEPVTRMYYTPGGAINVTTNDNWTGQLTLDPIQPKPNSVKSAVLHLLMAMPDGICRRDAAEIDIYELSNRIGELQADGWQIHKRRCERHNHHHPFVEYSI